MKAGWLLLAGWLGVAMPAEAAPPQLSVEGADLALTVGTLGGALLLGLLPTEPAAPWETEPFPGDEGFRGTYNPRFDARSDLLLAVGSVAPLISQSALGTEGDGARALALYGETLGLSALLNGALKVVVNRPRPYAYATTPEATAVGSKAGSDRTRSFYSGHSAMSFAAAVSGSLLVSLRTSDRPTRAANWGLSLALASSTAVLRVRAGKHFPSDVIIGALLGSTAGALVPLLHRAEGSSFELHPEEVVAAASGTLLGVLVAILWPDDPPPVALGPGIIEGQF